jgi:hypothetical protein
MGVTWKEYNYCIRGWMLKGSAHGQRYKATHGHECGHELEFNVTRTASTSVSYLRQPLTVYAEIRCLSLAIGSGEILV